MGIEKSSLKIVKEISAHLDLFTHYDRISFFGISMGWVVIRHAIKSLPQIHNKLHAFITFATPHLGVEMSRSGLVRIGMWLLSVVDSNPGEKTAIHQLRLVDRDKKRDTLMYKLSQFGSIGKFKYVLLLGSDQDTYCNVDSAFI